MKIDTKKVALYRKEAIEMENAGIRCVAKYATKHHVVHLSDECVATLDLLEEKFIFTYIHKKSQKIKACINSYNRLSADNFFSREHNVSIENYIVVVN